MAGPVPFVGREGELSRLLEAVSGSVRLVLVVGDAGVGKTRFAGEAMARAAAAGMVTVLGECLPLAETMPLLPVAGALHELTRVDGGGVMAAALDEVPGYVREELAAKAAGGGTVRVGGRDEGWRRGRMFSAVADLLTAAGETGPGAGLVLVVEDVQWADGATLDLLTFLVRAGSRDTVSVVATCRSDEAPVAQVADWLAQVHGAAEVEEIRLGPLSRGEVAVQVAALAGGLVPPDVVDEV
jgi:predicted ATPase